MCTLNGKITVYGNLCKCGPLLYVCTCILYTVLWNYTMYLPASLTVGLSLEITYTSSFFPFHKATWFWRTVTSIIITMCKCTCYCLAYVGSVESLDMEIWLDGLDHSRWMKFHQYFIWSNLNWRYLQVKSKVNSTHTKTIITGADPGFQRGGF